MPAQDVIARESHTRSARVIAGLLVLALVGAGAAVVALRRVQDRHDDKVARATLQRASFGVSAVGVAADHRVALVVSVTSTTGAKLVGAHVTGAGWKAVHGKDVGLVRTVDCHGTPPLPEAAAATVELHGQRRDVDLLSDPGLATVVARTAREACGDVEATRALALKASGAVRVPGGLQLALVVTNRSAHPVVLRSVAVGRLHVRTAKRLPVSLAPRATFLTVVVVDPRGCGRAAGVVEVGVDGKGGPGSVTVASADLPQLATRLRQEHCR